MANNQNVNKVVYAGSTLIDLTGDDVTAGDVLSGKKFHLASGAEATGTMPNIGAISGILKGDGNGGVSAATPGTDYATPAQALALGLTGASVGDLVRINSMDSNGKPTSWKKVPLNEIKCNKNLLDNWYFVGGGSQLGDGVFPINQRGQTTYSGIWYGIDRWTLQSGAQCTLNTDYITVKESQNYTNFIQIIETDLSGKKLTLSILTTDRCFSISFIASSTDTFLPIYTSEHNVSIYLRASANNGKTLVSLFAGGGANDNPVQINIIAIKLEIGSEQTLAHNEGTEENPVWVLNEIPDYGEELRKCQRYYQLFRTEALRPTYGEDCRPTMVTEQPTKATLTKGGVTYYTLSSEP